MLSNTYQGSIQDFFLRRCTNNAFAISARNVAIIKKSRVGGGGGGGDVKEGYLLYQSLHIHP